MASIAFKLLYVNRTVQYIDFGHDVNKNVLNRYSTIQEATRS